MDKNKKTVEKGNGISVRGSIKWLLAVYDLIVFVIAYLLIVGLHVSWNRQISNRGLLIQIAIGFVCIFGMRFAFSVYKQIWRYGGMKAYIRLLVADVLGGILYFILELLLPIEHIMFISLLSIVCLSLLGAFTMRLIYYFAYQAGAKNTKGAALIRTLLKTFCGIKINEDEDVKINHRKINVAIIGAGRVGVNLAEELINNPRAPYAPVCFVDVDEGKVGRSILDIPVIEEEELSQEILDDIKVQEIIFALPEQSQEERKRLYDDYKKKGFKIKVYDYPALQSASSAKRQLREFDTEDLLFRNEIQINSEKTTSYYKGKTVLISGGGGSIGSELCRQIAKMQPKQLIILDIYENGAYDIQQELKIAYKDDLKINVEIASVCDEQALDKIFSEYKPDVVIHAAAHKHVPLMEKNTCEAVNNNVFGTLNIVRKTEEYKASKFIMVSTDKAVNPTNIMGATKRMCEMIVLSHAQTNPDVNFNCTRFGNVLGSAGSVIPLFKKQIANGGPITITDKRIIRYFMTIPEASQLVLEAGAMAKNGELSVLDMGKPVKILELAESMINLTGFEPYKDIDIIETGLRPGEKLYEELLIKSETLTKTQNNKIFIEKDEPLTKETLEEKLEILKEAVKEGDDNKVRDALHKVVPTFVEKN